VICFNLMNSHNQNPSQLSRKHELLARAAPWFAGLSLLGAAAVEAASAQPASAGTEIATTHEVLSPQAFMNSFDKKLAREEQLMHSSPYFSSINIHQLDKSAPSDITIEYVGAPSKKYPGHYDWLAVSMRKGENVPLTASVNMGSNSKTYAGIKGIYKSGYFWGQVSSSGKFMPKSMALESDNGTGVPYSRHNFGVSSEGYPASLIPADAIRYSSDPTQVAAGFNAFLNQVHAITTHK
jgi:hypothetical protein